MKMKLPERRRFIRIDVPLRLVIEHDGTSDEVTTKNVSPVGLGFEIKNEITAPESLEILLYLPSRKEPVRLKGRVVWQTKTSLEDEAPYNVGVEITEVEDKDKNVFLKYLCDLLYDSTFKMRT